MNTKQAKDFLVQQTAEQAALESVALSEVEKKMMYFTESDPASCEYPYEVNDEFEAQYETAEYEAKISRLLHHAYKRLNQQDPERRRLWDQAIRKLREGQNPGGRIVVRAAAVIFWTFTIILLFFYYLRRSWPDDLDTRLFTDIAFVGTSVLAIIAFVKICIKPRNPK